MVGWPTFSALHLHRNSVLVGIHDTWADSNVGITVCVVALTELLIVYNTQYFVQVCSNIL